MDRKKIPIDLVLITDEVEVSKKFSIRETNSEGMSKEDAFTVYQTLCNICRSVIWLQGYKEFAKNPSRFTNNIIFSMYFGEAKRSSKSLIPAICEANNLKYIGADSYTHMLCNDKHTAKKFAKDFGLCVPRGFLVHNSDLDYQYSLEALTFPLVVKPNFGGGSNGIGKINLCKTSKQVLELVAELTQFQDMPILVEEYIEGRELEVILFGNARMIHISDEVQILNEGKEYFTDWIWGLEDKKIDDSHVEFRHCNLLSDNDKHKCINLFTALSKVEYMRIDFREKNGNIFLVELSPDSYLGLDGGFSFLLALVALIIEIV